MLQLQHLHERYGERVKILGLALEEDAVAVKDYLRRRGITFPSLLRAFPVASAYGVRGIPTLVLVDQQGNIRFRHEGYPGTEKIASELETLLREEGGR